MNNREQNKKILRKILQYSPVIIAYSCAFKLLFLSYSKDTNTILNTINSINLFIGFYSIAVLYIIGIIYKYCWRFMSLCRLSFWGHCYYMVFLLNTIPLYKVRPLFYLYIVLVFALTVDYYTINK